MPNPYARYIARCTLYGFFVMSYGLFLVGSMLQIFNGNNDDVLFVIFAVSAVLVAYCATMFMLNLVMFLIEAHADLTSSLKQTRQQEEKV